MKKNRTWLIVAIVVIILIIIIAWPEEEVPITEVPEGFTPETIEELPVAPEIDVEKIKKEQEKVAGEEEVVEEVKEAVAVAPGTSLVTQEGIVVTEEGEPVKTEGVHPMSEQAPQQSEVLDEEIKEEVAKSAIEIEISREKGFVPNQFKAKPGQAVTILLTAADTRKHEFRFRDSKLSGLTIVVKDGQSKALTFNAPTQTGSYEFFCPYPNHGGTGTMVVIEE